MTESSNNNEEFSLINNLENFVDSMNDIQNGFGGVESSLSDPADNYGIDQSPIRTPTFLEYTPNDSPLNFSDNIFGFPIDSPVISLSGAAPVAENGNVGIYANIPFSSSDSLLLIPPPPLPPVLAPPEEEKQHECFGQKIVTVADYSKQCEVHHVNRKIGGGLASTWKLRCLECTEEETLVELMVAYVFCFLTTPEGDHCFMVNLHGIPFELFLIRASAFSNLCPQSYTVFYKSIDSYNSMLADLEASIEEQKTVVEKCYDCEILRPYKTGESVDTSQFPKSADIQNFASQIRNLFYLEMGMALGEYMRKHIFYGNEIATFVMNFYDNRDRAYALITKEDVERSYIALYNDLVCQS